MLLLLSQTLFICAYQLFDGTLIPAVLQTMNSPVLLLHLVVVGSSLGGAVLCYTLMIDVRMPTCACSNGGGIAGRGRWACTPSRPRVMPSDLARS